MDYLGKMSIIPVAKYYAQKYDDLFKKFSALKKRTQICSPEDVIQLKNLVRK